MREKKLCWLRVAFPLSGSLKEQSMDSFKLCPPESTAEGPSGLTRGFRNNTNLTYLYKINMEGFQSSIKNKVTSSRN